MKMNLTFSMVLLGALTATAAPTGLLLHCSFDDGSPTEFRCAPLATLKPRLSGSDLSTVALTDGVHGKALELKEGSTVKYVFDKPTATALQELQPPFTIALWMKKTAEQPKHGIWLATAVDQTEPGGFELFWGWKRAYFRWGKGDGNTLVSPVGLLFLNKFHHIAVVHDGKTITLYVDARPVAQKNDNGNFRPVPMEKRKRYLPTVGQYPARFNAYAHAGVIDDLYIFTRALTAEEIASLGIGTELK